MESRLIIFEGPDGVGKSTLVKFISDHLSAQNIPNQALAFPGNQPGTLGKLVYDIHHSPFQFGITLLSPIGLQALHIAAHLDSIVQTIAPAIASGSWVVLDRFWWSTWVYGRAAGIPLEILDSLIRTEKLQWGPIAPSAVFLVERTSPLRAEQSQGQFSTLKDLYTDLFRSQSTEHEIVRVADADLGAAQATITDWVDRRVRQ